MITSGVILNYSSTLPGSQILFWCEEGLLPNTVIIAICTESAIWVPNPIEHSCSASSVDMFQTGN